MALYVIGDTHLSLGVSKPMDVFGGEWEGYVNKLKSALSSLNEDDMLVIAGDFSWGLSLPEAEEDFRFLSACACNKLLVKGNHDLCWDTVTKMKRFLSEHGFEKIDFLHNCAFAYEDTAVAGTRGWFYEEERSDEHDAKMLMRELGRLKASLDAARALHKKRIVSVLHYPPVYGNYVCEPICELLAEYEVEICCYGHLHGESCGLAYEGVKNGVKYCLVSGDYVKFQPKLI